MFHAPKWPQDGAPSYKLVEITPLTIVVISAINHSEMGVMFANLSNELGHHLATSWESLGILGMARDGTSLKAPAALSRWL